jgi:hypothetical protein
MKKILISIIVVVSGVFLIGCSESIGDTYDFTNSVPSYVQFSSVDSIAAVAKETVPFSIVSREAFSKGDVTVTCSVAGKNSFTQDIIVKLLRFKKTQAAQFVIPANAIKDDLYTVTIKSAVAVDGASVRIGQVKDKSVSFSIKVK